MGDMEHMTDNARQEAMQEEEEEILAEEDALHPYNLEQKTPWAIFAVFNTVISFLVSYGWFTVGVLVVLAILWRIFNPKIYDWLKRREADKEAAEYHKDPDKFLERERAMDDVRRRMQDRYNQQALEHAEKAAERQKEIEEQKRQERIEDWERHQRGEGYRSKSRLNATSSSPVQPAVTSSGASGENKKKSVLRPDYNPLTGDIGGGPSRWRPDRRGTSGGG